MSSFDPSNNVHEDEPSRQDTDWGGEPALSAQSGRVIWPNGVARTAKRAAKASAAQVADWLNPLTAGMRVVTGRLIYHAPISTRFRGAYPSYQAAREAIPSRYLKGYDHAAVAPVNFEAMCAVAPWDYPVLFWLKRLYQGEDVLVDAGGHMGTKFRAFRAHLDLGPPRRWVVYDLPAIVRAAVEAPDIGALSGLSFTDDLSTLARCDVLLASGLLQYLDTPFAELIAALPAPPKHIIINKLAVREGETVVTLEKIGDALAPYHIRARAPFFAALNALGYRLVDQWEIPSLSHVIETHPEFGASTSVGCVLKRSED